jgi:diguanylate cyclase (GGDEF)-like protein
MPDNPADAVRSMAGPLRALLVVHDVRTMMRFRDHLLPGGRFLISQVSSLEDALITLREREHDVALVDLDLPEAEGRDVLHRIRVASDVLPVIALFDEMRPSLTTDAVRLGVQDCLSRYESDSDLVARVVEHAVERHRLLRSLRDARAREHHEATHDALTRLPNRQAFLAGLGAAISSSQRRSGRVALLFFDLDGFKAVNDSLGHEAGDALLSEIGQRLRTVTRRSDLVARLGGDEFVVALCDTGDPRGVMRAAEQFVEAVCEPMVLFHQECQVGVSIGVALYPDDAETPDALIRAADLAMYNAKQTRGNMVRFYEEEMDREVHERFALVAHVRDAAREGEFFLEFQPQIDVMRERVVGAEALLRWQHPERGRLAPADFLGIAEDTGLMQEIGDFALGEACRAAAAWGAGPDAPSVAVNISGHQLANGDLRASVRTALAESGLPASRLVLELSERAMFDPRGHLHGSLQDIAHEGITLAVDHFGAGAGSLAILQEDAIRMLKLDRSLLADVGRRQRANRILTAILTLSRRLGLETVAEGVESIPHLRALRFLGCARMQGFLLGEPVSAAQLGRQIADDEKAPWRELLDRPDVQSTLGALGEEEA